jgi:uncharacterized protein (DUF362 family)
MTIPVAIARILEYESTLLDSATALVLEESGLEPRSGQRVLVKPNLVAGTNARHSTTNPLVVRAACAWLLDHGARVTVADSPAFGPASYVARASGLGKTLAPLGIKVGTLGRPVPTELSGGTAMGLSADALEADLILNVPKLKVHCQMVMSGAVKNLFGCVVGFRKAMAHHRLGRSPERFRAMIMDVYDALPRTHHLMDAIRPLHRDGPTGGVPYEMGLLAASGNGVGLDTLACSIIGLIPAQVPLWEEALRRHMDGAHPADLGYPLEKPALFNADGFEMAPVRELEFDPVRVVRGRVKSLLKHLPGFR